MKTSVSQSTSLEKYINDKQQGILGARDKGVRGVRDKEHKGLESLYFCLVLFIL
mgnify:CR=1 FL=1